jgi:hypothetical protein
MRAHARARAHTHTPQTPLKQVTVDEHITQTWNLLKDSVRTLKKIVFIRTLRRQTLFKGIIAVYSENTKHMKPL